MPSLVESPERELLTKAKQGDPCARQVLVRTQRELVHRLAERYADRGVSQALLVKEGVLGLMRAVTRYHYDERDSFSQFASQSITKHMRRVLREVA